MTQGISFLDIKLPGISGAGIIARYPVYPGYVIRFDSMFENKSGIVKWSLQQQVGYKAGIKFI